jgi:hypothetical protein
VSNVGDEDVVVAHHAQRHLRLQVEGADRRAHRIVIGMIFIEHANVVVTHVIWRDHRLDQCVEPRRGRGQAAQHAGLRQRRARMTQRAGHAQHHARGRGERRKSARGPHHHRPRYHGP